MAVATVVWEDQGGASRQSAVKIEDTSRSGACLRIATPIRVGTKLAVDWREGRFSCVARYCRPDGEEYSVGVQRDVPAVAATAKTTVPTVVIANVIQPPPSTPVQPAPAAPKPAQNVKQLLVGPPPETPPSLFAETPSSTRQADAVVRKIESKSDSSVVQPRERRSIQRAELQTDQPRRREERTHMLSKWLNRSPKNEGKDTPDGNSTTASAHTDGALPPSPVTHPATPSTSDAHAGPGRPSPSTPQGDFLPLEDIYRATPSLGSRTGYSIHKVVDMLKSNHIRALPNEMKSASVLMALEVAGISAEEMLKDARYRLEALSSYEADQEKRLQEYESRKLQENAEIQLEVERLTEHYRDRMKHNLEELALARSPFSNWQTMKQEEVQRISAAAELCAKRPVSEAPNASPLPSDALSAVRSPAVTVQPPELVPKLPASTQPVWKA